MQNSRESPGQRKTGVLASGVGVETDVGLWRSDAQGRSTRGTRGTDTVGVG